MSSESGQSSRFSTTKCNLSNSDEKIQFDVGSKSLTAMTTTTIGSLAVRRPDALALSPIDTTVQLQIQKQRETVLSVDSGVDVNDGPSTKVARRTVKSIDIGFNDLSYTIKVIRYDKLRRGEFISIFLFYIFWVT